MPRFQRIFFFLLLVAVLSLSPSTGLDAQVTTATLYGVVRDSTGAVLPGAMVTATNQGTNLSREIVTDERGEFALPALPTGPYTLKIELPGFKTYTSQGLELGAGQTVRQTFVLEVGQLSENITVAASAPLVETASSAQQKSFGTLEARELPLARRNVSSLLNLASGAVVDEQLRTPRLNGVSQGGTLTTVDGTDAVAGPESRSMGMHGAGGGLAQNQIDVLSIEAVAEVQVIKGILPAEYGGAVGGQVNLLSRSGTNELHGSAFENYQNEAFFARDPFLPGTTPKPSVRFNQFGGSLGGPIVRNRVMFFTTYEGYRETGGVSLLGNVPTQQLRDRILAALPFPETKIALDALPLPNEPINADIGRYRAPAQYTRRDNHIVAKGDVLVFNGNLSVTFTRMRPYALLPSRVGNGTTVPAKSDRINAQYVLASSAWVSESRFGWNRNIFPRFDDFWSVTDPTKPPDTDLSNVGRRVGFFTVPGLFSTPFRSFLDLKSRTLNAEQKLSRVIGTHNVKVGFKWVRQGGGKTNPNNPTFSYQTVADLLANIPNSVLLEYGKPPHTGHLDEYGVFIQDDWRVNKKLVLNLGLRYDSYSTVRIVATTNRPAEIVNLNPPTDLRKLDFGSFRDPDKPYDPERVNLGPRLGFAWTLDEKGKTVVRGGSGVLYSAHLYSMLENNVSDPFGPADAQWNRTEAAARGLKWPMYGEDLHNIFLRDLGVADKFIYGLISTHLPNPFTVQTMINVQRAFGVTWTAEAEYVRTDGRNFPLHRPFTEAFDRATGVRPNPLLGRVFAHYVTSEQTMVYNALQTSLRKRFSNNFGFDLNYTLSKGWANQGGALISVFHNPGGINQTQDFWNPNIDRAPLLLEARHRSTANAIYGLPWLRDSKGTLSQILGGWQISSILSISSGLPLRILQPSGIPNSRPDYAGGNPVLPDWGETLRYLNKASFALVPTFPATGATIRPGTANPADVRGPGSWTVNLSIGKTFKLTESVALQVRADAFNALNHVNYNSPNLSTNSPDFGRITSAGTPRVGQVGARLTF